MIRVSVMANASILADAIASTLAKEIDLDVIRLTRGELGKGRHHSVVIIVDEGEPEDEAIRIVDLFRDHSTLLIIMISLKSRDIFIYESYQLANPGMERMITLVSEFARMNLKKNFEEPVNTGASEKVNLAYKVQAGRFSLKEMSALFYSFFLQYVGRKNQKDVTLLISFWCFAGFGI